MQRLGPSPFSRVTSSLSSSAPATGGAPGKRRRYIPRDDMPTADDFKMSQRRSFCSGHSGC